MATQTNIPQSSEVQASLKAALASPEFRHAERMCRLLRFLVESALEGKLDQIKESLIGVEVFDREPGYDPKADPVVRGEVRRLRAKLEEYYRESGRQETVRIDIVKGRYVPEFRRVGVTPSAAPLAELPLTWRRMIPRRGWILACTAVLVVGVGPLVRSRLASRKPLAPRPFTSAPGTERTPAFSPDGQTIAYASDTDIFIQPVDQDTPERVARAAEYPAWSPDGKSIAFLRQLTDSQLVVYTIALSSRAERKLGEVALSGKLDWSPDGKLIAAADRTSPDAPAVIVALLLETGGKRQITRPTLDTWGDSLPAFSSDGRALLFRRSTGNGIDDLYVQAFDGRAVVGEPRRLTFESSKIEGYSWSADDRSAIVSVPRKPTGRSLWRFPVAGGEPERIVEAGPGMVTPAVARRGDRLAFVSGVVDTNIWVTSTQSVAGGALGGAAVINSTKLDTSPQFSPDGRQIAFRSARSGANEIWVCGADGNRPRRLTDFGGPVTGSPRWSPDGQWLVFDSRPRGNADIFVIPAGGGAPQPLTGEPSEEVVPSWSHDGQWIYFASNRTGKWQVWKQRPKGGQAEQVTWKGGFAPFESPDGRFVYYARGLNEPGLWRIPRSGGEETQVAEWPAAGMWGQWAITGQGVYFLKPEGSDIGLNPSIQFLDLATGQRRKLGIMTKRPVFADGGMAVSPDGQRLLYTQIDTLGSDIYLLDGFR